MKNNFVSKHLRKFWKAKIEDDKRNKEKIKQAEKEIKTNYSLEE